MKPTLFGIEGPWPGRLAIVPRPRGGDWLEDEVAAWREGKLDVVVSLLTAEEADELELAGEEAVCARAGVVLISFPVEDGDVPPSVRATAELVRRLEADLAAGRNVGIHCRQGGGRAGLLAACVLTTAGLTPEAAWARVTKARGCPVPDTEEQRDWVRRLVSQLALAPRLT